MCCQRYRSIRTCRGQRLAVALALVVLAAAGEAVAAGGASSAPRPAGALSIARWDASGLPRVDLFVELDRPVGWRQRALSKDDLRLYLDDEPVHFFELAPVTSGTDSLAVALSIDTSGSVKRSLSKVRRAAHEALEVLGSGDTGALGTFDDAAVRVVAPTQSLPALRSAIDGLSTHGKFTHFHDGLAAAAETLAAAAAEARLIVLITDGKDEGSRLGLDEAIDRVRAANAAVIAVGIGSKVQRAVLERVAQQSRGWLVDAAAVTDPMSGVAARVAQARGPTSHYAVRFSLPGAAPGNAARDRPPKSVRVAIPSAGLEAQTHLDLSAPAPPLPAPLATAVARGAEAEGAGEDLPAVPLAFAAMLGAIVGAGAAVGAVLLMRKRARPTTASGLLGPLLAARRNANGHLLPGGSPAHLDESVDTTALESPLRLDTAVFEEPFPQQQAAATFRADPVVQEGTAICEDESTIDLDTVILQQRPVLALAEGGDIGWLFDLENHESITIGRSSSANIRLYDRAVSNTHARMVAESGQFVLYDLHSSNGTYVNERRVERQVLQFGDVIRIGSTSLRYQLLRKA
ncbi:MAG: FHA domain-containing protein [Candidatus Schekmanbacteria bacterium]|nr:FHA domain-containing protein [Candidatus Schekmanbacteria bacterium]